MTNATGVRTTDVVIPNREERKLLRLVNELMLAQRGITYEELGAEMGITKQAAHMRVTGYAPAARRNIDGPASERSLQDIDDAITAISERRGLTPVFDPEAYADFQHKVTTELMSAGAGFGRGTNLA